jgi:hypothetical protein
MNMYVNISLRVVKREGFQRDEESCRLGKGIWIEEPQVIPIIISVNGNDSICHSTIIHSINSKA